MRLLEGTVEVEDPHDAEIAALKDTIRELREEVRQARTDTARAKQDSERAMCELRRQLGPLYKALQMVFGELDAAGVDEASSPVNSMNARTVAVWDQWKQKLDKGCAKAIDALLTHGEMTRRQLAIACGYSPQNVSNIISKLNSASLITKNEDRVALRAL
jgi:outer membrane murein-binding lipoprotein Lpp